MKNKNSFDLKSYLQRIGCDGELKPTLETLNRLTEEHTKSIPFENLDVILNKGIFLSDEAIFDKLVTKKRGGYCFEQNALLLQALESLGFDVKPLSARVRVRFQTREPIAPRTHMFLRIEIDGESFLTDVGMGAASLTKALKLVPDIEQNTPHDTRRLVQDRGRWYQQVLYGTTWHDTNEFTLEEMPQLDREVANWYTSTHPQSHFKAQIIAARALGNGQRISLQNRELTRRDRNGDSQKNHLQTYQEFNYVLIHQFGLNLSEAECQDLFGFAGVNS